MSKNQGTTGNLFRPPTRVELPRVLPFGPPTSMHDRVERSGSLLRDARHAWKNRTRKLLVVILILLALLSIGAVFAVQIYPVLIPWVFIVPALACVDAVLLLILSEWDTRDLKRFADGSYEYGLKGVEGAAAAESATDSLISAYAVPPSPAVTADSGTPADADMVESTPLPAPIHEAYVKAESNPFIILDDSVLDEGDMLEEVAAVNLPVFAPVDEVTLPLQDPVDSITLPAADPDPEFILPVTDLTSTETPLVEWVHAHAGDSSANLRWEVVNTSTQPVGFIVEASTDNGASWPMVVAAVGGHEFEADATNLTNGTRYLFRVAAITPDGVGEHSTMSTPLTPTGKASQITSGSAVAGDAAAVLYWDAPDNDGGAPVVGYIVEASNDKGHSWHTLATVSERPASGYLADNLTNGVAYAFRVAAINANGVAQFSERSPLITPTGYATAPAWESVRAGDSSVNLTWTAPSINGGLPIDGYMIEMSVDSGASWTTVMAATSGTETSASAGGLKNGLGYLFRVAAVTFKGMGAFSENSTMVTPTGLPSRVQWVTATPGDSQVELTWAAPSDKGGLTITSYLIESSSNNGTTWESVAAATDTTDLSRTILHLVNGTEYLYRVAAVNDNGVGAYATVSMPVTPTGFPSAPTLLSARAHDAGANLNWMAPVADGGREIIDYVIDLSVDNGASWLDTGVATSLTHSEIVNLTNGVEYVFRVAAVNGNGVGAYSATSNPVMPTGLASAPSWVLTQPGDSRIALHWDAPSDLGGLPLLGYRIESTSSMDDFWTTVADLQGEAVNTVVTGLRNGCTYAFRVAAATGNGLGMFSDETFELTPTGLPGAAQVTEVTPSEASVIVSWEGPDETGGMPVTGFLVQASTDGGASWSGTLAAAGGLEKSAVVGGLAAGTSYLFRVQALNGNGRGAYSEASTEVTPAAKTGSRMYRNLGSN